MLRPVLNDKQLALLNQSLAVFDACWDDAVNMVEMEEDGKRFHSSRDTIFYALGLLLRSDENDRSRAIRCIRAVLDCQFIADGEIFDGTFRSTLNQKEPVRGKLDWEHMPLETRYNLDLYEQRLFNAFRDRLNADPALKGMTAAIERQLQSAVYDIYPVVWDNYDPNWREFIISTFQLILIYFENELPDQLVADMDTAARRAIRAAVARAKTDFTPLNTNIRIMHVMICDWFGTRWQDEELLRHAEAYAEELVESYRRHHAVPQFNSPTYNGVVFTFIGFWQRFGSSEKLKSLSRELEAGLWSDFAEFYNPAMQNVCGPYSRAYELEMTVHTALPAVLYLAGVLEELPPVSIETDCNPVLVLSQICVPEHVLPLLKQSRGERTVTHQFEELAERGDPRNNHALCTTTAWITDDLMLGAMRGSCNTSYQLHPAVAFWRNNEGALSTMKLLRRTAEGELKHFHTVFFDVTAEAHTMHGQIRANAGRDVVPYFELQGIEPGTAVFDHDEWHVSGLTMEGSFELTRDGNTYPAPFRVERHGNVIRVCFPMKDGDTLDFKMHFDL